MKKNLFILGAALILLLTLTACSRQPVTKQTDALEQPEQTQQPESEAPAAPDAQKEPEWTLDPADITDEYAADTLIRLPELALSGLGFTFDSPRELRSQQLYLLFLAWAEPEELSACCNAEDGSYVFSADTICKVLDRYLEGYCFDSAECPLYDAGRGAIVTPMAGAFGGNVDVQLESKTFDGNTVVLTALLDGSTRKTYTVAFYDGGYRYLSVQQLSQPELRLPAGTLLLRGQAQEAYAAVTDEEICLWDAASGGQLLAVARFPVPLSGAKDALTGCDFTDLDGDGSSELTADFSFADGSTASLVWFYADGGLVYNEEFSRLPGEPSAAGAD